MGTEHPIRFGYADENAKIVTVDSGPLPEGLPPLELKEMLWNCGFMGAKKPVHWRRMHSNAKTLDKSNKNHHIKKPHLMDRDFNRRVHAHKWWDPLKYKGPYPAYMRKKRGIVGPSIALVKVSIHGTSRR